MKTRDEILKYIENRARVLITCYKKEKKLMCQQEKGSQLYENHRFFASEFLAKMSEIKEEMNFITESEGAFYKIYNSIAD
jgi:phosphoheptose isomerase